MRVRRLAVLVLLVALAGPAAPATPSAGQAPLSRKLARALAVPGLDRSRTAALALDLRTGQVIFAHNAARALPPASVEKLTVTYAALSALGSGFRFHTEVLGRGARAGATWRGDLVLRGYGDPTLSTGDLRRLAASVRQAGIRAVSGGVLGDESFFDARRTAPGWKPYYYAYYCAPLSALVVDRAVKRGRYSRSPAAAAAVSFKDALRRAGVRVAARARAARGLNGEGVVLATDSSAALWKILRFMDRKSDNFTAEMLLKQLGALYGRGGTTPAGAAVVRRLLEVDGIPLAGVRIVDGSGLSLLDRLTAQSLGGLLSSAWTSPTMRKAFVTALPVAGRSGTLSQRLTAPLTRGRVIAKTGTTLQASSLAGYVRSRYAFAILNSGSPVNSWTARTAQDRFVSVLARAP